MKTWTHYCNAEQTTLEIPINEPCSWCDEKPDTLDYLEAKIQEIDENLRNSMKELEEITNSYTYQRLKKQ